MDNIYRLLYNPFNFSLDSDRKRRTLYMWYGEYKPTRLKRFMIWIMNERIDPIDWEEVPPFVESEEESGNLQPPRNATLHPYECLSQPNMLTQENIFFRRLLILGCFILMSIHLEKKRLIYRYTFLLTYYYDNIRNKLFFGGLMYYLVCRSFANKDYQMPYN